MRSLAALTIAAAAGLAMSSRSPGADYPSIFPAVHDMPPPRADTPLDADQVQQATETLITERNHLSAAAQGAGQDKESGQFIEFPPPRERGEETARRVDAGRHRRHHRRRRRRRRRQRPGRAC